MYLLDLSCQMQLGTNLSVYSWQCICVNTACNVSSYWPPGVQRICCTIEKLSIYLKESPNNRVLFYVPGITKAESVFPLKTDKNQTNTLINVTIQKKVLTKLNLI